MVASDARLHSVTTLQDEIPRLLQALDDLHLSQTASVSLLRCSSSSAERQLIRELSRAVSAKRYVVTQVPMSESGLDSPEKLVRDILLGLTPPGESRSRGLLWLLERHYDRYGKRSADTFAEACRAHRVEGDLVTLCGSYLATDVPEPQAELRAYHAWCDGTLPPKSIATTKSAEL